MTDAQAKSKALSILSRWHELEFGRLVHWLGCTVKPIMQELADEQGFHRAWVLLGHELRGICAEKIKPGDKVLEPLTYGLTFKVLRVDYHATPQGIVSEVFAST